MLRSALEDMDSSEVVGFLAMLENQSGWKPEAGNAPGESVANASSFIDASAYLREGAAEPVISQKMIATENAGMIRTAASTAMEKGLENYLPDGREQAEQHLSVQVDSALVIDESFSAETLAGGTVRQGQGMEVFQTNTGMLLNISAAETLQQSVELSQQATPVRINEVQGSSTFAQASPAAVQQTERPLPDVRDSAWGEALGQRLVMMVGEQRQEARIRLDPPELGTLGVKLVIEGGSVSVQIASAIPQVREMLELEADRLRESLENQGLELADLDVAGDSGSSDQQEQNLLAEMGGEFEGSTLESSNATDEQWAVADIKVPLHQGMINTYA